jgi:hypothetical protein
MAFAPAAFAHHADDHTKSSGSGKGSTNTPGNDRKEGYENNSKTPQDSNHGKGSDHDGDADSNSNTAYTEDNDTNDGGTPNNVSDSGDNRHPSGKDRSVENGKSGTQGKSESNPDDSKGPMRYEGVQGDDKPNGPGGTDLADQDGNNGCGNDDDFDDDNNGWCGRPTKVKPSDVNKPTCPHGSTMGANGKCETPKTCPEGSTMTANGKCDQVLGEVIIQPTCPDDTVMDAEGNCLETNPSRPEDEVLNELIERDDNPARPEGPSVLGVRLSPALAQPVAVAGAVLPFTGGQALSFLIAAFALILAGAAAMMFRRSEA